MMTAMISISFFIVRAVWSVRESALLQQKWVKITPHIVDTLLLACAIYLASFWPLSTVWIWAKVVALVAYIGVGTFAIKRGKTPKTRGIFALVSVAIFVYIVGVAMSHNVLSWLAL